MIHGFEHFIFELNDGLYHLSGSRDISYITEIDFLALMFIWVIVSYIYLVYVAFNPKYEKAISIFTISVITIVFTTIVIIEDAYWSILVVALFVKFYTIISNDKKYENIKNKIDRFF